MKNCYVVMERVFTDYEHDDIPRMVCIRERDAKRLISDTQKLDVTRDLWFEIVELVKS